MQVGDWVMAAQPQVAIYPMFPGMGNAVNACVEAFHVYPTGHVGEIIAIHPSRGGTVMHIEAQVIVRFAEVAAGEEFKPTQLVMRLSKAEKELKVIEPKGEKL